MDDKIYDEPTKVTARDGKVILDGPDGVDVAISPDAALETGDRLLEGAKMAFGQQAMKRAAGKSVGPE